MAVKKPKLVLDLNSGVNIKSSLEKTVKNLEQKDSKSQKLQVNDPRDYKRIPYQKIKSSPLNDYPINNISEIENLLLQYGLLSPFSVNYDEDTDCYELESGDRRFHALKNLFEKYEVSPDADENTPEKQLYQKNLHCLYVEGIYCMVEHGERDQDSVRARIIVHNESTRPFDAMRTASKLNELSQIYTRQNNLLPKSERVNVNQKIAEELKGKYTVRQIIRYKNFDKLTEELKNIIIKHNMNIAEISTYHTLTEKEQSILAAYIENCASQEQRIKLPSIEELRNILAEISSEYDQYSSTSETAEIEQENHSVIDNNITENIAEIASNIDLESNQPISTLEDSTPSEENFATLKNKATEKLKESQTKNHNKINDTINALQKKSTQLEKVIFSHMNTPSDIEEQPQLDLDSVLTGIDTIMQTLNSIKATLQS